MEGSVSAVVHPMMHLLQQSFDRGDNIDDLHQMLTDVYRNFTSVHKAIIDLLENVGRKFHEYCNLLPQYGWMREQLGMVITFCRWQLNFMVRSKTSALLLVKIESHLFMIVEGLTDYLSREELDPDQIMYLRRAHISTLASEIEPVYQAAISRNEASFNASYLLITNKFIMEFLSQVHEDLNYKAIAGDEERKTMRGYLLLLRYYFEFTAERINGEEMNDFLISSQLVASKMAYYAFFSNYTDWASWKEKFSCTRHRIESDIRLGCLRTTLVLPQHVSRSILAMNDELLTIFVNCIHDNLSDLLKDKAFTDLTSPMIDQFTSLQSGLSFLIFLLAYSRPLTADQDKLSDIRVRFLVSVRNVESLILQCFNNEMNGSITSSLSDFIENMNLIKEESIEIMKGSVTEVRDKMPLLQQCGGRVKTSEDLRQMLKYVYRNFTSIHKAVIALLEQLLAKFHRGPDLPNVYRWMREDMGIVITFCRWQLNCMAKGGGGLNKTSALLLEKIERHLLMIVKDLTDYLSREELDSSLINDCRNECITPLASEIEPVYEAAISTHEASLMPGYLLIGNEFILEFLNQVHEDLHHKAIAGDEERKTMRGYLLLLRYYFEFTAERINGEEMNDFLLSSQLVASKMAYYAFFSNYTDWASWKEKFSCMRHRIESDICLGCLRTTSVLPQHVSSSIIAAMNDELLTIHVNCIHDSLVDHLKYNAFTDVFISPGPVTDQFDRFPSGLAIILFPDSGLPTATDVEKLSNIRVWFRALVRSMEFLAVSCFNHEFKGSISSMLSDFINKVDLMKEETIEDMYCVDYFPRTHRMHFLIILLGSLEDLIMSWKDQSDAVRMNLILLRSFIQNTKVTIDEDSEIIDELDFSEKDKVMKTLAKKMQLLRNYLQLDIDQINAEETSELLISAQVTAFEMACHYSLRYGEVHWWKVYVWTKDRVGLHMRIGVLRAAVLSLEGSISHPLSDEFLKGYVDCIQENMTELLKDEASCQIKAQFERLHRGLLFISADQEKSSDFKLCFQTLLRNVGSVICSCFINRLSNLSIRIADLLENLDLLQEETQGLQYTVILHRIRQEFPTVHLPGFFDLLLDNWKEFMDCESDTIRNKKEQCQAIHETLILFRSFMQNFTTSPTEDEESQKLCQLIAEAGYVAEYLLDSFAVEACPVSCTTGWISDFTEHIKLIEARIMEVNCKKANDKVPTVIDVVVGFEVEMKLIKKRLYSRKKLDVVSIVGMPGSGKTTLARKVYEDPSAEEHFDVRAWCTVSHVYSKKDLFLTILGSKLEVTDLIRWMSETELSVMVHKVLKGRRYLIVLDDVWGIDAFMGLKNFFPDDNIGSRIMLTSRSKVIALQAKYHSDPIEIGLLTDEESWDLMERKVYPHGKCPSGLCQLGKQIAQKCRGLPLAVVVVAGFLAKSVGKNELWEQVAENLSSSYLDHHSQSQWMGPLELSYKFLPDFLKPLFLYLGAFPGDKEIPADKLIWLWIADGLVQKTAFRSIEIQARISLMDLIDRNVVLIAKRSSDGRVKACHVHDLLRDMCLAKAKEEKFLEQVHVYQELPESVMYQRRLSVLLKRDTPTSSKPVIPHEHFPVVSVSPPVRTLLFFNMNDPNVRGQDHNPDFSSLKLSRVIHLENTKTNIDNIIKLLHLRYISISTECNNIPESISNLQNLETLMIKAVRGEIALPHTIWEMVKLRHLHVDDRATFRDAPENSSKLENLITLSTPVIDSGKANNFFGKLPNVQKLRCIMNCECHDLESLDKLTSLKASYYGSVKSPGQFKLPVTLRKLSLSEFRFQWSQVYFFQKLLNLEVLKLRSAAVQDEFWDTGDDEFPNLKVLKLENLNIKIWNASEKNFPRLEKLVLERCKQLVEIPFSLGDFYCLQKIEVIWCSHSAAKLAKEIEEEQNVAGNYSLNVHIYPPQLDSQSSS